MAWTTPGKTFAARMDVRGEAATMDTEPANRAPTEKCVEVHGWRFASTTALALNSEERTLLARDVLHLAPLVPLPEMVFAGTSLAVEYLSQNLSVRFETTPALKLWADPHKGSHSNHTNFDFTYNTGYIGSVVQNGHPVRTAVTEEKLPLEKLMQHVQILHYDQVLLFEDDVRDLGEIYLEAKIVHTREGIDLTLARKRVMDFGFLVLCRYYCRLDGKELTLTDTRYYHEFGQAFMWRDTETRHATLHDLRQQLYPYISMTSDEQRFRQLDFAADVIYPILSPASSVTEKIYLAQW